MPKATWNGTVLAQSEDTIVVEGNHYFPRASLDESLFRPTSQQSQCPWKGTANYLDVVVGDDVNAGAAWYYAEPKPAAEELRGRAAFWRGVRVET